VLADGHRPALIVTVSDRERRAGCLIGFATDVSIDPPRFPACLSELNATIRVARRSGVLAIHVIPRDRLDLAHLFGSETADDGVDQFASCGWSPGPDGVPVLDDALEATIGRIVNRIPLATTPAT
jgi:flavin reductase (DIM6/NTAB) family NADH-FMN oxidoreductase RutF